MKHKLFLVLAIVFVFGIIMVSSASNYKSKISSDVYKKLEKNEEVRVVIKLKQTINEEQFLINGESSYDDILNEKRIIKEKTLEKFKNEDVKKIFDSSMAVVASINEIELLRNDPNVESIEIDKPIKAFLQDSVPLVNATRTWPIQLSGLNITGISETICIIDTGINFSHPDLAGKNQTACLIDCLNPISGCVENCSISDDNGHGTHCAGIAAANGGIKGVAIGSNLIGVKVLNSAGTGSGSDLNAGIDWCIANSATYNISVISMSLGTDCTDTPEYCYNYYCDSVGIEQSTALRIDNATAHNISVIVAAGNDANYTSISSPACVKNSTTISATDKSDNIATAYSNRNNMTDLVAPGSSINSTKSTGGYEIRSGTSMATPMVAGAFALVREFFRLQNGRVPTPLEIQNALNSTGKRIPDTLSGLNYSRINIYAAVLSLDNIAPNVTLISPENNTINSSVNQTFSCSATDLQLANITFYLWNSTNSVVYNETKNITGTSNISVFSVTNLSYDSYKWNCLAYDVNNNSSFASSNFSLTITSLSSNLVSPADNLVTNQNQSYNCSFTTESAHSLENSTFYIWNSSNNLIYNQSQNISGLTNNSIFYYNFTSDGNYSWNCLIFNNNSGNAFADSNFSVKYDITAPNISSITSSVTTTTSTINWITNENTNASIIYGTNISNLDLNSTNSSFVLNQTISLSSLTSSTLYYYNITSCDNAGNCVRNGTYNFTTSAPEAVVSSSGSGNGGSGGGSTFNTYNISYEQGSKGYTQLLNKNDKIKFVFFDTKFLEHTLTINNIKDNSVNLTILSNPINLLLGIGQSAKLNLTSSNYYDLYIKLDSIENNKAKITIQIINEEIPKSDTGDITNKSIETPKNVSAANNLEDNKELNYIVSLLNIIMIIVIVGVIFIIISIIIIMLKNRKMPKEKEKNIKEYKAVFESHIKPKRKLNKNLDKK